MEGSPVGRSVGRSVGRLVYRSVGRSSVGVLLWLSRLFACFCGVWRLFVVALPSHIFRWHHLQDSVCNPPQTSTLNRPTSTSILSQPKHTITSKPTPKQRPQLSLNHPNPTLNPHYTQRKPQINTHPKPKSALKKPYRNQKSQPHQPQTNPKQTLNNPDKP